MSDGGWSYGGMADDVRRNFLRQSMDAYASYFGNQAPRIVDWYAVDEAQTRHDGSLHGVEELIGPDSPVKFRSISGIPLFAFTTFSVSPTMEEGGRMADLAGEATMLPEVWTPQVDDAFVIPSSDPEREGKATDVYRVESVSRTRVKGKSFHRIAFHIWETSLEELSSQVSSEEQVVQADEGSGIKVVPKTSAASLRTLRSIINGLQDRLQAMHVRTTGEYAYEAGFLEVLSAGIGSAPGDAAYEADVESLRRFGYVLDDDLVRFAAQHRLSSRSRPYRNESFHSLDFADGGSASFRRTFFWLLEKIDWTNAFKEASERDEAFDLSHHEVLKNQDRFSLGHGLKARSGAASEEYGRTTYEPVVESKIADNQLKPTYILHNLAKADGKLSDMRDRMRVGSFMGLRDGLRERNDEFSVEPSARWEVPALTTETDRILGLSGLSLAEINQSDGPVIHEQIIEGAMRGGLTTTKLIDLLKRLDVGTGYRDHYLLPAVIYVARRAVDALQSLEAA